MKGKILSSLSVKIFLLVFSAIMLVNISSIAVINFFAEEYYLSYKTDSLVESINEILLVGYDETTRDDELKHIATTENVYIMLLDSEMNELYSSDNTSGLTRPDVTEKKEISSQRQSNSRYDLENLTKDIPKNTKRGNNKIISGWYNWHGDINEEHSAILLMHEEDITLILDAIQNLLYVLIPIGLILATLLGWVVSLKISRPIVEIKEVAEEIGNLKFDSRYKSNRKDEIGELGNTLNWLALKLDDSFKKLDTELQKEKSLDKLRTNFIAQVSHEIRTPVAVISSYNEALKDEILDNEEEKQAYDLINQQCNKLKDMLENILDLSELEAGTFKIVKENINIYDIILDSYNQYKEIAKNNKIDFDISPKENSKNNIKHKKLNCDKVRINQVMVNFLSNAVKHTNPNGSISISLNEHGDYISVEVMNTGNFISDDDMPNIWDSFYKGSEKEGRGIGLSIVKNILEAHGYEYYVKNTNEGVVFGFSGECK